jgi:hypothetical protein
MTDMVSVCHASRTRSGAKGRRRGLSLSWKPYEETVREFVGSGRPILWTLIFAVGVLELAVLFL